METVWGEVVGWEMRELKQGVRTERSGNYCTAENNPKETVTVQKIHADIGHVSIKYQYFLRCFCYYS